MRAENSIAGEEYDCGLEHSGDIEGIIEISHQKSIGSGETFFKM